MKLSVVNKTFMKLSASWLVCFFVLHDITRTEEKTEREDMVIVNITHLNISWA